MSTISVKNRITRAASLVLPITYVILVLFAPKLNASVTYLMLAVVVSPLAVLFSAATADAKGSEAVYRRALIAMTIATPIQATLAAIPPHTLNTIGKWMIIVPLLTVAACGVLLTLGMTIGLLNTLAIWIAFGKDSNLALAITRKGNIRQFNKIEAIPEKLNASDNMQQVLSMLDKYKNEVKEYKNSNDMRYAKW